MAVDWGTFRAQDPALATIGRERLAGRVCYLATSRATDGAPRVHPVTPVISEQRLFLFMEPTSPKGSDLDRDARYALHCGVEDESGGDGEFFVSGIAERVTDPSLRREATGAATYSPEDRHVLFHLLVQRAMLRRYEAGAPVSQRWGSES